MRLVGKYFPYGQERPSATTDGKEKFATYFRDSETGLDYADQRYHQVGMGRFMTPDPYKASAGPSDPGSWNRYAYVGGDPINFKDPWGLDDCHADDDCPPPPDPPLTGIGGGGGGGAPSGGNTGYPGGAFGCNPNQGSRLYANCVRQMAALQNGPSCTSGSVTNPLTSAQTGLLGGTSFSSLSAAQQLVFYTITADAAKIGIDLSGYTLGSISIAGSGSSQTELYLTANNATSLFDLTTSNSFKGSFAGAGWDPFHRGGYGPGGNWRQTTPTNSMQIVATASGDISIDIDPNNPNLFGGGNLGSVFGHAGNVFRNTLTGTDTNYSNVAAALNIGISRCP